MITEFSLPEAFTDASFEKFRDQMLNRLPSDIDITEGGFAYDFIAPPALLADELVRFWLALGLQNAFHMWANGDFLTMHAENCGLERREATHAYGNITVTADPHLEFPAGFVFSVPGANGAAALDFELVNDEVVPESGVLTARIRAVIAGTSGNIRADRISIMKTPVDNVYSITNTATSGGTEIESDDSLRKRIDDFYAGRSHSFVGNKRDYRRWALSVPGVGYVHVIPAYDGANSVKLVICDSLGKPANDEILKAVELYIFGEDHNDENRLAPIGVAKYAVVAPVEKSIDFSLDVKPKSGFSVTDITENIRTKLESYFLTLADAENYFDELRYVQVSAQILNTDGVADFKHLRINGSLENVSFTAEEVPAVGSIDVTLY